MIFSKWGDRPHWEYDAVNMAVSSCAEVRLAVESGAPPYDGRTSAHWLGELQAAMMRR